MLETEKEKYFRHKSNGNNLPIKIFTASDAEMWVRNGKAIEQSNKITSKLCREIITDILGMDYKL